MKETTKTRTPKMQIDEKMQQEGSKNDEKIIKNRSPWVGKSRKMGAGVVESTKERK